MSTTAPKSAAPAIAEIEAIAGQELGDVLASLRSGARLSLAQTDRLDAYLREEQQAHGLLSRDHLMDANGPADGRALARSVAALVRWVDSEA